MYVSCSTNYSNMNQTKTNLRQAGESSSGFGGLPRGLLPFLGGFLALSLAAMVLASLLLLPRILPMLIGFLQCGHLWVVVMGSLSSPSPWQLGHP